MIPNSVALIGNGALLHSGLINIFIANFVISIGQCAFPILVDEKDNQC